MNYERKNILIFKYHIVRSYLFWLSSENQFKMNLHDIFCSLSSFITFITIYLILIDGSLICINIKIMKISSYFLSQLLLDSSNKSFYSRGLLLSLVMLNYNSFITPKGDCHWALLGALILNYVKKVPICL